MAENRTERATCRFVVRKTARPATRHCRSAFHETVSLLNKASLGFELLGGTTVEQANKIADVLNERVLNVFVDLSGEHPLF